MKNILLIGASGGIGNKVAENLLTADYFVSGTFFNHQDRLENLKTYKNFRTEHLELIMRVKVWRKTLKFGTKQLPLI